MRRIVFSLVPRRLCCQYCPFPIQRNRDKISMRKFDVRFSHSLGHVWSFHTAWAITGSRHCEAQSADLLYIVDPEA